MLPNLLGFSGWIYGAVAVLSGLSFIWLSLRLLRAPDSISMRRTARTLFTFSLSYLFVLFLALLTDNIALRLGVI